MKRGLLLFAHGARDARWALPFEDVARRVKARSSDVAVVLAFLEFMTPDLIAAGNQLVDSGCATIDVVPLFLGTGGHVRKDLPLLVDQLRASHAGLVWTLREAVGESDRVIDAMASVSLGWLDASV